MSFSAVQYITVTLPVQSFYFILIFQLGHFIFEHRDRSLWAMSISNFSFSWTVNLLEYKILFWIAGSRSRPEPIAFLTRVLEWNFLVGSRSGSGFYFLNEKKEFCENTMLKHWNGDYHGTKIFLFDQKIDQEKSEIFLMFADSHKCTVMYIMPLVGLTCRRII